MTEITEYITNDVKAIDSFDSGSRLFSDLHFSHFPVLEEGVYIGSITVRILKL
jgi:predicted transcriptional regulator